jgi:non-specific serine/threonine protein kinase
VEAVSQLRADRDRLTPFRRRARPPHNLPLQLTRFIGREQQLAQTSQLLLDKRLLTLTGSGGIGKTRMALEVTSLVRDAFPDGAFLVDLAPLTESELVTQAVAEPLGVRAEANVSVLQALQEYLRGRRLLLILDNCEQVVEACAGLAEAVLRACPEVHILATSREPLRVGGETTWRVPALSLPGKSAEVPESESVRLFADRAQAAAGVTLNQENAPAVAQICQQLDGIPLAIELAAARCRVMSVEHIAGRLNDRFRLLVGGARTSPPRQQTLRAAIDWSYDLLTLDERRLLSCLSVFAGGWTLEAAEQVGAGEHTPSEEVLELLAQLVDKSLVQAEPDTAGQLRYRLLDSVRAYASDRLRADGETAQVQRRHYVYYRELAGEAEKLLLWGAGNLEWLVQLDREYANMRAALSWSVSEAAEPALGLSLAGSLGHYWYTRADRAEGRGWLKRALAQNGELTKDGVWALLWAGGLAHGQTDYDEASRLVSQALEVFKRLGDQRGIGWGFSFLGHIARARAELPLAATCLELAIAAFRETAEEVSVILPLAALGFTVSALGDQARASELLEESVGLARKTGSAGRLAIASIYFGQVLFAQGDTRRAATAFKEALNVFREWNSAWGMAECFEGLAVVAALEGNADRAARLLGAAARLRESIGAPVHPVDRADHERAVAASQAALGAEAYAAAWQAGRTMSVEEAIERTVAGRELPVVQETQSFAPLTRREREVAVLIARGQSNRQIAEELVIAERTVANHVENIFNKLGFRSRTQVATWITERQR